MKNVLAFVVFGLLVIAATACNAAASAPPPAAEPSDDTKLMRLVERLLTNQGPYGDQETATVLVGQMPSDFDIPLPEGSDVIGSVINENSTQMVLDLSGKPEDSFPVLTTVLASTGWVKLNLPRGSMPGGFVPGPQIDIEFALFCSEADDRFLSASAYEMENGVTDLRLHLSKIESYSPCDQELITNRRYPGYSIFPPLSAPAGARQRGGSSGGGGRDFHTSADLDTTLSVEQVDAHYHQQLSAGGWTVGDSGSAPSAGWSTWRFTDDEETTWGGLLLVMRMPDEEDKLFTFLRASRRGPGSGSSGATIELLGPLR